MIQSILNKHSDTGLFVKIISTSGKNDADLYPCHNIFQIIDTLTNSVKILKELDASVNNQSIVIVPWNYNISSHNEFRVIVIDRKIVAISQQRWYEILWPKICASMEMELNQCLPKISESIINLYDKIKNKLDYNSVVLDIYFDFKTHQTHLIECNPGDIWSASGSSLFHWIKDINIFKSDHQNIYFRYLI